jgi:hypothetical protein
MTTDAMADEDNKEELLPKPQYRGCRHGVFALHECPYAVEVYGSHELCTCCDYCTAECSGDI